MTKNKRFDLNNIRTGFYQSEYFSIIFNLAISQPSAVSQPSAGLSCLLRLILRRPMSYKCLYNKSYNFPSNRSLNAQCCTYFEHNFNDERPIGPIKPKKTN